MKYRIAFFGTTEYSLKILEKLIGVHDVCAIFTKEPSPVFNFAREKNLKFFTGNPNSPTAYTFLKVLRPHLGIVAAYGYIISKEVLRTTGIGFIGVHPSLLPKYRGPAPIQWALLNGEKKTGITTFWMTEKVDAGNILMQREVEIKDGETYGELVIRLGELSGDLLLETLDNLRELDAGIPQDEKEATYAPKIEKAMCRINWQEDAEKITNKIRAFSPKPGAFCFFRGKRIIILKAKVENKDLKPGEILKDKKHLIVGAGKGSIEILELKPEGKKIMTGLDFLNGYRIKEGEKFE